MDRRIEVDDVAGPDGPDAVALRRLLSAAVEATLDAQATPAAEISVTLLDDEAIADLNRRYLGHEGPTDVISFPLHDAGDAPLGDIYIGREQAVRQAEHYNVAEDEELVRLAVHGTLHVLGYEHPAGEEREDSEMWQRQETIVRHVLAERTA